MTFKGARYRHGLSFTPIHLAWSRAKRRCYNPNHDTFAYYGGRGIVMCDRWRDSFEAFAEDMGPHPGPGYSLDRIDSNGPYSPENCRWATHTEQTNNMRSNRRVTFNGETKTVAEWSRVVGISQAAILLRLRRYGWTVERALTEVPFKGRHTPHAVASHQAPPPDNKAL